MKVYDLEGKNEKELLNNFLMEHQLEEKDVMYVCNTENAGIFKGKKSMIHLIKKEDVIDYIKEIFQEIEEILNMKISVDVFCEEDTFKVNIDSEHNSILIGKDGKTLKALQAILKQAIKSKCDFNIKLNLDVSNYKEKKLYHLEKLTRKLANDVIKTKVDVKMDCMNSYERRYVHNIIAEYTMLTTKSEGIEPNRYVVIKYNED